MRRCFACHSNKPETEFPSVLALTCKFCTPFNTGQSPAISRLQARQQPIRTERATQADDSVARSMMYNAKSKLSFGAFKSHVGPLAPPSDGTDLPDDRPLIDKLHEATFGNSDGMQWIKDKYKLRMALRKARCFTLDDATSSLVADFSMAVATDLEAARRMSIPPFPITWIEFNNRARLDRMKQLGVELTPQAAGETDAGPAVDRVGWLITHDGESVYTVTYVTSITQGVVTAPRPYWWHTREPNPSSAMDNFSDKERNAMRGMTFGMPNCNVHPLDAHVSIGMDIEQFEIDLLLELSGELRHVWGFLVALGAGQLGVEAAYSPQPKPTTERKGRRDIADSETRKARNARAVRCRFLQIRATVRSFWKRYQF